MLSKPNLRNQIKEDIKTPGNKMLWKLRLDLWRDSRETPICLACSKQSTIEYSKLIVTDPSKTGEISNPFPRQKYRLYGEGLSAHKKTKSFDLRGYYYCNKNIQAAVKKMYL